MNFFTLSLVHENFLALITKPTPATYNGAVTHPDRRAGDKDRESTLAILRTAVDSGQLSVSEFDSRCSLACSATTMGELVSLVDDLQELEPSSASPVLDPGRSTDLALFGGTVRSGVWACGKRYTPVAIFGGIDIDLRNVQLQTNPTVIYCVAAFGGIDIYAPRGMVVDVRGHGVFGGFDTDGEAAPSPDSPVVYVDGIALFGGVDVHFT